MLKDFKKFILRGNVVDLAVGVVIGAAFGAVVTSLVKDVITPLISALIKMPKFSELHLTLNHVQISYGNFIDVLVAFIIVAAAIFFLVVVPLNKLMSKVRPAEEKEPTERECPECLSAIPKAAKRCKYCGTPSKPAGKK